MGVCFHRRRLSTRPAGGFRVLSGGCVLGVLWVGLTLAGLFSAEARAQQPRTVRDGVYTAVQARRGQATFRVRCASCHGERLGGGTDLRWREGALATWDKLPITDLIDKIEVSMPQTASGAAHASAGNRSRRLPASGWQIPVGQEELR